MINKKKIEKNVKSIIESLGENPNREGLIETPERVARMYEEIFSGINVDPKSCLTKYFTADNNNMVLVKNIVFHSMCEHHFMPFFGEVHIAYIPENRKVTGLSKLARLVNLLSKRPQIQENLTNQIAETIIECLEPKGVMVIVEAKHMCMTMRGIKSPDAVTCTTSYKGIFEDNEKLQEKVIRLVGMKSNKI